MRAAVERDGNALVVGMTLVPGLYSRNRSFALFEDPDVKRARRRAGQLRGIVRQLSGAQGGVEHLVIARGHETFELRYRLPGLHAERRSSLSELEVACVRYLCGRAGVAGLHASEDDRARIDAALKRLANGLRLAEIDAEPPTTPAAAKQSPS